ncbi:hypothetical protein P171DRAFT_445110 [Karstenula rhodostoma CBS 690.94]|uniref:Uncharacterized protein n=1 Tax=Karstenula rhodostoma CBS 690.94 TaxID=1392251 RepID=A0A9P4UC41_9PLEO|nr:hypothetical protein P171DRAFT_445110 [Karstenula rhodostoma CBS 690.94]
MGDVCPQGSGKRPPMRIIDQVPSASPPQKAASASPDLPDLPQGKKNRVSAALLQQESKAHIQTLDIGNENIRPELTLFSHPGNTGHLDEKLLSAPSVQQVDLFATGPNGYSKSGELVPMGTYGGHLWSSTDGREEHAHVHLGTAQYELQAEETSAKLFQRGADADFESESLENYSLPAEPELSTDLVAVVSPHSVTNVDIPNFTDRDDVSPDVEGCYSPALNICSSDDGDWTVDDEISANPANSHVTPAVPKQDIITLPLELWAEILGHIEALSTSLQENPKYLKCLSLVNIPNLHLAVKAKQWKRVDGICARMSQIRQACCDHRANARSGQQQRTNYRSWLKRFVAFAVDTGHIVVCCPAYSNLTIASKLLKRRRQGRLSVSLLGAEARRTTRNDLQIMFRQVEFSNVRVLSLLRLDVVITAHHIEFFTIEWLSIFECLKMREFFGTQSLTETGLEAFQWRDLAGKTSAEMNLDLQNSFLDFLASRKKLQALDVHVSSKCAEIIKTFADKIDGGHMKSLSIDTADLWNNPSPLPHFQYWASKFPNLNSVHHPVSGADTWLSAGDPDEWETGSEYESLIRTFTRTYAGCLGLRHMAIGASSSTSYGTRIVESLLCQDLAEQVDLLFKAGGISLTKISVNVREKDGFRVHHFIIEEQGTINPATAARTCGEGLKKAWSVMGLGATRELDDHLPVEIAKLTPSKHITFKKWWETRSCVVEERHNGEDVENDR